MQQKIKEFCKKHNLNNDPEHCALDLVSEVGELCKELLKMTDYGKKPLKFKQEVGEELGDALYSLITLANSLDIDLDAELKKALNKYEKRIKKKGNAGS